MAACLGEALAKTEALVEGVAIQKYMDHHVVFDSS
jgi:hypothetical protein